MYTILNRVTLTTWNIYPESDPETPLSSAPRRLQDLMMEMHTYDIKCCFVKGNELLIAIVYA